MIIGITGFARSGKDEAGRALVDRGFVLLKLTDNIKRVLYALNPIIEEYNSGLFWCSKRTVRIQDAVNAIGWEEAKTLTEVRELMQRTGTEASRDIFGDNFWVDDLLRRARDYENVVFTDMRYNNCAEAVLRAGGITLKIKRPSVDALNAHPSENGVDDSLITKIIYNDGTISELRNEVIEALNSQSIPKFL